MRLFGVLLLGVLCMAHARAEPTTLATENAALLERIAVTHGYDAAQMAALRTLLSASSYMGQGNPAITEHAASREACQSRAAAARVEFADPAFERVCGAKYMAPLYDPARERPEDARACIDQFEFPDIPCDYPVVWVKAKEAAQVCAAVGKRLCDAHEWEGACQGALEAPDYRFDLAAGAGYGAAVSRMRAAHNRAHAADARWSYGPAFARGVCAQDGHKSAGCDGGNWARCGSNTYPAGHFPACRSPLGVYDLNGNAAEHMNLPLSQSQMASAGSTELGVTEMKGSWFIFDRYRAHPDWCRWRAPFWHGSRVLDAHSHANYHLGFRCCKSMGGP